LHNAIKKEWIVGPFRSRIDFDGKRVRKPRLTMAADLSAIHICGKSPSIPSPRRKKGQR
jgi:hypothetical protein